ncbi:hypothetical protein MKS83_03410 [Chryseobacterium sp. Y16C]|uniref:hypothetical protein n=1 Tax=Chryseobacterium sp. Y16C TaxID=2920939 RepID=UPI001F0ADED2|nr:hypothetical protein [Chryseobacterium sp. Y16C]UMQ42745.1 hypothetical protein MKS83_03410 [Chryseobacterium sp. Y16C]
MKYFKESIVILLISIIVISCKKDDYVLYPIDKACDSITIKHTYFNSYKFSSKYGTADAKVIKDKDSVKILELDLGPDKKLNKLIINKNTFAVYPGLIDGNEFVVKKIGDLPKPISDSQWGLLKNCRSKLERFRNFEFDKSSQLFKFYGLGYKYGFTYKTKDSINYQLFMKTLKASDFDKFDYDPDFVSIELKLVANNIIRAKFNGMKLKNKPEITFFNSDSSDPEIVYFFKYNNKY